MTADSKKPLLRSVLDANHKCLGFVIRSFAGFTAYTDDETQIGSTFKSEAEAVAAIFAKAEANR